MKRLLPLLLSLILFTSAAAQNIVGRVIESESGKGIDSAIIKNLVTGQSVLSDKSGSFTIAATAGNDITIQAKGFFTKEIKLPAGLNGTEWVLKLEPETKKIGNIVITHDRLKEKLRESPVTVESQTAQTIKQTPASDFYEGLGHLRGVDVTAASMGLRVVNTRGFNSTSPVRSLQLIDGVDNQSPGLNFSLGNFLGASEIDVNSTEIVVGASSAYYGPNAFNGVINMTTKSPWEHRGFSAQLKLGERQLGQIMLRYAQVYTNQKGREVFAWKGVLSYMHAYDWVADNANPTTDSRLKSNNPGGYDAVNRYGDEVFGTNTSDQLSKNASLSQPGLGGFTRTGYWEKDLVNYNTSNLKTNLMLAWKINSKNELQYGFNFGTGNTVYQGDNRYSLRDVLFFQHRIELKSNKGFLRFYTTNENSGNTYDAVLTAFLLQTKAKSLYDWNGDYSNYWVNYITPKVQKLPGYDTLGSPNPFNPKYNPKFFEELDFLLAAHNNEIRIWHDQTRAQTDRDVDYSNQNHVNQSYNRFAPGTPEFEAEKNRITHTHNYSEGGPVGSGFFDRSALLHLTGERNFSIKQWHFKTGFSARMYRPYSQGTLFLDTGKSRIVNSEAGIYSGFERRFLKNKFKWNVTARLDKNQNFPFLFSPGSSLIYSKNKLNTWRISYSKGIRNPTLQDQYLHYNVGRATLLGNIDGVKGVYELQNFVDYLASYGKPNSVKLKKIDVAPIRPEQVNTVEGSYKGIISRGRFSVDAGYYYSVYKYFIGYKLIIDAQFDTTVTTLPLGATAYRVATNSKDIVTTSGFSAAVNYFFAKHFILSGNWSYNALNRHGSTDALIPAYNTPKNKFNLGLGATELSNKMQIFNKKLDLSGYGFNTNFKWIQGYLFEGSPQFTGAIPTYWMLDAQISKKITKWQSILKIGASNITNNKVFQVYGGPRIGRMAYISFTWEP